jgi:hypothetical protein
MIIHTEKLVKLKSAQKMLIIPAQFKKNKYSAADAGIALRHNISYVIRFINVTCIFHNGFSAMSDRTANTNILVIIDQQLNLPMSRAT